MLYTYIHVKLFLFRVTYHSFHSNENTNFDLKYPFQKFSFAPVKSLVMEVCLHVKKQIYREIMWGKGAMQNIDLGETILYQYNNINK